MSHARRTRHFARSAKQVRSVLLPSSRASHSFRTSRKMPRSPRFAHKAPVMQVTPILTHHNKSCRVKDRGRVNLKSQRIIIPPAGYFTKDMLQNDRHKFDFSFTLLVNNAGQGLVSVFECIPIETAQHVFDTNYFGVMRMLKAVLPGMKARRKGHIINISSVIGVNGTPFSEVYSASKFALEGLTESLAPTLSKFDIR